MEKKFKKINNMFKKIFFHHLFFILLGVLLGVSSKYGDIAYANTFFYYFGLLSSGILVWLVLCTTILLFATKKKQAMILLTSLMLPMLISYYLYSYFVVKYLSFKVIVFWIIMLVISLITAHYVWNIRFCKKFRALFIISAIIFITYDAFNVNGFDFLIMILEIIFSIITLLFLNKSIKNQ